MIRLIPLAVYLLIIAVHEVLLRDLTRVFDVTLSVAALSVLLVSMYKEERTTIWYGFAAGVVTAASTPHLMGWYCLSLAALGLAGTQVKEHLDIASLLAKLVVLFCGTLIFNIAEQLFAGWGNFFHFLFTHSIPGAFYTTVIGWVFLLFKEQYITRHTIEEAL